jgi:hypothetical protein
LPEPDASVDLINASGVVGHHLKPETIPPLIAQIQRVLVPAGVALLDVGPTMPGHALRHIMAEANFAFLGHYRSWFGDWTGELAFRRAGACPRGVEFEQSFTRPRPRGAMVRERFPPHHARFPPCLQDWVALTCVPPCVSIAAASLKPAF